MSPTKKRVLTVNYDGFVALEKVKLTAKVWVEYVRRSCLKLKSIIISFSGWKLLISYWLFISCLVKVSKKVRHFSNSNPDAELYHALNLKRVQMGCFRSAFKVLFQKSGHTPFKVAKFESFAVSFDVKIIIHRNWDYMRYKMNFVEVFQAVSDKNKPSITTNISF